MSVEVNFLFQKEWNIVIKITTFTPFRVVFYSKTCPSFNSLNEWKFTRLHLESTLLYEKIRSLNFRDHFLDFKINPWYPNTAEFMVQGHLYLSLFTTIRVCTSSVGMKMSDSVFSLVDKHRHSFDVLYLTLMCMLLFLRLVLSSTELLPYGVEDKVNGFYDGYQAHASHQTHITTNITCKS